MLLSYILIKTLLRRRRQEKQMKPTVGRVVHYYDGRGNGPWMAWVVWIGESDLELYIIPPCGLDAPGYLVVSKEPQPEPTASRITGTPFWCWPPKV